MGYSLLSKPDFKHHITKIYHKDKIYQKGAKFPEIFPHGGSLPKVHTSCVSSLSVQCLLWDIIVILRASHDVLRFIAVLSVICIFVCTCLLCLLSVLCSCVCTVSVFVLCLSFDTGLLDLDAGRLARSQNPEGPATGNPDTGFLGFHGS